MQCNNDKISVIIPVYNIEKYISRCIESVINQTYKKTEIIIVNDGSTDTSGNICAAYAEKDSRIILINQENQGLSMARNNAIDVATGEYIGFVDGDDWVEVDMFSTLYQIAVQYDADIAECSHAHVEEAGKIDIRTNEDSDRDYACVYEEPLDKISDHILRGNKCVWNKIYKRHLFDNIRFPKGKIFEDVFTTYKLIDKANKIVKSSAVKYNYLKRTDSLSRQNFNLGDIHIVEAFIERYKDLKERYPNDKLEEICRKQILVSFLNSINRAYSDNKIEDYKEEITALIDSVRQYSFYDCDLSQQEINALNFIFKSLNTYIFARKNLERIKKDPKEK